MLDSAKSRSLHRRGLALQRQGRQDEAIAYFDRASRMDPENIEILYDRAVSLQMGTRFEEAVKAYDAVLRTDPENFAALVNKGLCYSNPSMSREEEALMCFDEALKVSSRATRLTALEGTARP